MKFQIEVLQVSQPSFTKTSGGGYSAREVAFKRDGKVEGKKLVDFDAKGNPGGKAVYNYFSNLKGGEFVEVEAVKGEKFWNWVSATPVGAAGTGTTTDANTGTVAGDPSLAAGNGGNVAGSGTTSPQRGRVTGSNYETPQERAKRQVYIVRQSSITAALTYLAATNSTATIGQVIEVAKQFEEYVFEPKAQSAEGDSQIPF